MVSSVSDLFKGARIFTKLGIYNAYHLIRIREGDKWKIVFNTPTSHYKYLVMPFGLKNAPAVFQNLINDIVWDMLNKFAFFSFRIFRFCSHNKHDQVQYICKLLQQPLLNNLFHSIFVLPSQILLFTCCAGFWSPLTKPLSVGEPASLSVTSLHPKYTQPLACPPTSISTLWLRYCFILWFQLRLSVLLICNPKHRSLGAHLHQCHPSASLQYPKYRKNFRVSKFQRKNVFKECKG